MKRIILFTLFFCTTIQVVIAQQEPTWVNVVGARKLPAETKYFWVKATGDGNTVVTAAIQQAIDACTAAGGGVVLFKPGKYVSGSIFLKDNVQFRIDNGVELLGSQNFSDYPELDTRIAGIEMKWPAALINAVKAKNVAIGGDGIINARGKFCWDLYWAMRKDYDAKGLRWIVDYDAKRVRTILIQESEDATVSDVTIKNAGFWTVQVLYSSYVTVKGLTIRNNEDGTGPSTDGVNIDSSTWTLIEDCDVDCNDDNFCMKSGRDWDGLRVNRPTEYVVIKNCVARRGAGLVTLGSETSGGIRHIYATGLKAKHTDNGLRIKSATTRGGVVEDIYFVDAQLDSVGNAYQFNLNWYPAYSYSALPSGYAIDKIPSHWKAMLQRVMPIERGWPEARNIFIRNVHMTNVKKAFEINGMEQRPIKNVVIENASIQAGVLGTMEFMQGFTLINASISVAKPISEAAKTLGIADQERLKQ